MTCEGLGFALGDPVPYGLTAHWDWRRVAGNTLFCDYFRGPNPLAEWVEWSSEWVVRLLGF